MSEDGAKPERSIFRKVSIGALIAIPGLVAFFATVTVEDARSNFAGWMHFFGVDRVPAILASPFTDAYLQLSAVVFAMLACMWSLPERFPHGSWILRAPGRALRRLWMRFRTWFREFDAKARAEADRVNAENAARVAAMRARREARREARADARRPAPPETRTPGASG